MDNNNCVCSINKHGCGAFNFASIVDGKMTDFEHDLILATCELEVELQKVWSKYRRIRQMIDEKIKTKGDDDEATVS